MECLGTNFFSYLLHVMSGSHQGNTKNNRTKPQGHRIFILPANSHGNHSKEGKKKERQTDRQTNLPFISKKLITPLYAGHFMQYFQYPLP